MTPISLRAKIEVLPVAHKVLHALPHHLPALISSHCHLAPATMASSLIPKDTRHSPASGPLYWLPLCLEFPPDIFVWLTP